MGRDAELQAGSAKLGFVHQVVCAAHKCINRCFTWWYCQGSDAALAGIVACKTLRTIASELSISESKAEVVLAEIHRKFAVRTTADLVRIGIYAGYDAGAK
jgi:hypothetical protein